jgi:arylsulfatase A-like enzyme
MKKPPPFYRTLLSFLLLMVSPAAAEQAPNVVFIIADDASRHFGQAYHCDWVKTPNIDRLARNGLVFDNCYVVSAKCAPCRASLLTGRNTWQNAEAANHQSSFPATLPAFGEVLREAGVHTGKTGKVWNPGKATDVHGKPRDFGLPQVAVDKHSTPGMSFATFLNKRPADAPFFYWHGSYDPHRGYDLGSGRKAGKKPSDIDHVPAYWPDNDTVRDDMLDYAIEVERFDTHVGEILAHLEEAGLTENTLVVVTSDHGMPFPRVKGHTFDDAHRVPAVMHWPKGIRNPGRRVDALVSFIDFAPTFLELAGIDPAHCEMELTGHSITDLLEDEPQRERPFLLIGRERNDVYARPGSPAGLGYPARGIRSGDFLYIRNFAPERWPCGDPELSLKDTDSSPTKALIEKLGPGNPYWEHAFGKRPPEMLFNVLADPDCVDNLATDEALAGTRERLRNTMMAELEKQGDPRSLGKGDVFDAYPTVKKIPKGWSEILQGPTP